VACCCFFFWFSFARGEKDVQKEKQYYEDKNDDSMTPADSRQKAKI